MKLWVLVLAVPVALHVEPAEAQSFPPEHKVLARNTSGGWLNIDFIHAGAPLEEARRCVESHQAPEAVACFAFATEQDYRTARPIDAGNFRGPLCWEARWQRNKLGSVSGGTNDAPPSSCPSSEGKAQGGAEASEPSSPVESGAAPAPAEGPIEVTIDFDIEVDSHGRLRISGTTNLPDETRLSFSLAQQAVDFLAQDAGHVRSGSFESAWFSKQGAALPPGTYQVGITVPVYNAQPESVQRRLGPGLEAMTGPHVDEADLEFLGKVARVHRTIEISQEL